MTSLKDTHTMTLNKSDLKHAMMCTHLTERGKHFTLTSEPCDSVQMLMSDHLARDMTLSQIHITLQLDSVLVSSIWSLFILLSIYSTK